MKNKVIIYLTDNNIYLKVKEKTIKYKIDKNIIEKGKISNIPKFIKTYNKLSTEHNLNKSLLGNNLKILINPDYTKADLNILKNIFLTFNYRKISFENITKYYKLNKSNAYINILSEFLIITYLDEYKKTNNITIPINNYKTIEDLMSYIKYIINDKELYLLGEGELLNNIFTHFESKFNNKTYIFSPSDVYLISKAK